MQLALRLLRLIPVDRFRPAHALAADLGVSRHRLTACLARLRTLGVPLHAVRGRGYRLLQDVDLLDASTIRAALPSDASACLESLEVLTDVDSTNRYLLDADGEGVRVCLAERQSAGRGRRGRGWLSPFACSLYLSLRWPVRRPMHAIGGLSLAVGVAVAETLLALGVSNIGLKWPNDLVAGDAKLGGVLVELAAAARPGTVAVIGVGVNGRLSDPGASIDQPWTDLATLLGRPPDRNRLASRVLAALIDAVRCFDELGFAPFRDRYARFDALAGRRVRVLDREPFEGVARGVAADGALLVEQGASLHRVLAGEVSVRAAAVAGTPP